MRNNGGITAPRPGGVAPRNTGGTQGPRPKNNNTTGLYGRQNASKGIYAQGATVRQRPKPKPSGGPSAPPAASPYTPAPWDSRYEQTVAGANKKYLGQMGNFDYQEQAANQEFGLAPGFNDYRANPNSRAAVLQQTYQNANRGTLNSAGNQLYSGSTQNAFDSNRSSYGRGRDELEKLYRNAMHELSEGRTQAQEERDETDREAYWDRMGRAEEEPLDYTTAPGAKKRQKKRQPQQKKNPPPRNNGGNNKKKGKK